MMHDTDAHKRLWGAVLIRAIADALWLEPRRSNTSGSGGSVTYLEQHRAKRWFGTLDFRIVCTLADMDPAFMRDRVGRLVDAPEHERREFLRRLLGDVRRLKDAA